MKIAIVFFVLFVQICRSFDLPPGGCCSDLVINNEHYNVTAIYEVDNTEAYPTDAHYDTFGNLFFVESGRREKGFYFDIKMIQSMTTVPMRISGLPDGASYSIAVDRKIHEVYFGTAQGIFRYSYTDHSAKLISKKTLKLNMIFVDKDGNKYITEIINGVEELYLLDGEKKIRFHTLEALNELAIDDKNNFYFIKEEKLFVLKSTLTDLVYLGNVTYDGIAQMTIQKETLFIASENLVYYSNVQGLKTVENVPGKITAVAFDSFGDFVLGVRGKLLKYRKNECYLREKEFENDY